MTTIHKISDVVQNYILFIIVLLISISVLPQDINLKFNYLNKFNYGLSSNKVFAIYRDSKGFLWIGTQAGLNRFDGNSIVTYYNDTSNNESLSHNYITSFYEDHNKHLWIGTVNGVSIYNALKDAFKVYTFLKPDEDKSINRQVNAICEDQSNHVWIALGRNGGISQWDSIHDNFINHRVLNTTNDDAFNTVTDIKSGKNNVIWFTTFGNGLVAFYPENKRFEVISDRKFDMGTGNFKRIFLDNDDNIWIMTEGKGLFKYNLRQNVFSHIPVKEDGTGTSGAFIRCMVQFDNSHLLIGVDQGGINSLNTKTGKFEYIKYNELQPRSLCSNGVWSMFKDKEGILWVGTSVEGISYYNPKKERFIHYQHYPDPNSLSYNAILCLYEDKEGKIWIGTDGGGLNIFDPVTETFKIYKHDPKDLSSIQSNVILSITEDNDHNVWMGTWANGLLRYNRLTRKFYQYLSSETNPATIGSDNIWSVMTDNKNNLWISNLDYGIDVYNKNGFNRIFRYNPVETNPDKFFRINVFYRGQKNKIWIARGINISYIDTITHELKDYIKLGVEVFVNIFSLYEDTDENLWIGTGSRGLFCYNKNRKLVLTLNMSNGLPDNKILGILEDNSNNLWIATDAGMSKYNKFTKKCTNYPQNDPNQNNNFKEWTCIKSKTGMFYFGGYNGITAFNPENIIANDYKPYVYINDFQIFGKSVKIGEYDSLLRQNISETKKIVLSHSLSVFSFSFSSVNFTQPENSQYKYKLDGFDKEWTLCPANRRYVTYTNLDPGTYTFQVMASNNEGVWNENGASIEVIIKPPFWMTWWFRAIAITAIILILMSIYAIRVNTIRERNKLLERLVDKRTLELKLSNDLLMNQSEELNEINTILEERQQKIEEQSEELMTQKEELVSVNSELQELNATKDKFFSIIAHDIKNPFNTILGFSDLFVANFNKWTDEKKLQIIGAIRSSSKSLFELLENLLQWSRSQRGLIEFDPQKVELNKHVEGVIRLFKNLAEAKKIEIKTYFSNNEIELNVDLRMLDTILRNLISNAIKFTYPEGTISVKTELRDSYAIVSVIDNGMGMSFDVQGKLFKIDFHQLSTGTNNEKGTGLGLILVKEFVEKHKGKIWMESEPNKGSAFHFSLPLN